MRNKNARSSLAKQTKCSMFELYALCRAKSLESVHFLMNYLFMCSLNKENNNIIANISDISLIISIFLTKYGNIENNIGNTFEIQ